MALTSGERTTLAGVIWSNATRTLTSFGTLVTDVATAVWSFGTRTLTAFGFTVTTSDSADIAAIKAKTDNLPTDPADASDIAASFSTVNSSLTTIAGYVDTEVAAIKAKTDNLPASPAATGDAMTLTGGERAAVADAVWDEALAGHATAGSAGKALSDIAAGGAAPTVAQIVDGVWDEPIVSHLDPGTTGETLNAGGTGDPWDTALPGSYGPGTAGAIVGTNLDATVSSRAVPGDSMTLTGGERDSIANALLDLVDAIETGLTPREALRLILASAAGQTDGAGTGTFELKTTDGSKTRAIYATDIAGNRTGYTEGDLT
jgi:hypothetical protein